MKIKNILLILLVLLIVVQIFLIRWLTTSEVSKLFEPVKGELIKIPYADVEFKPIAITTKDSVTLKGWEIYAKNNDSTTPWLIYFHDRGHEVSFYLNEYLQLRNLGMNILAVDYRGFGESGGEISEAGLYLDADAIYYHIRYKKEIPFNRIIIYGEGIGAAAAVDLGQNVNAGAIVLVNPFTSAPELLKGWYPYAWPKIFSNLKINSLEKIKNINTPKIFVTNPEISYIPSEQCEILFDNSKKYRWRLKKVLEEGINQNAYYNNLVQLLNNNARFNLGSPPYSLADTLLNTINKQGIGNALRQYHYITLDTAANYDMSEYQLDYLGDKLYDEDRVREALEIYALNLNAYPNSGNAIKKRIKASQEKDPSK
ncbi:MAG: alpha/beta hydrolase [bacterium]